MRTKLVVSLAAVGVGAVAVATLADPSATSVPFGPNGDAIDGTSGQAVALSPTSLLVLAEGQDAQPKTTDDLTLLVTGLGGTPHVTTIATPYVPTDASRIERLSSTRAALVSAGPDGNFGSADDALLVLDRLGSQNVVTSVTIGGLGDNQQFTPERLAADRVVVPSTGNDLTADTADDEVVVVSTLAVPPQVTRLAAPFQRSGGRTRIVAVSPTEFLIASDGPNRKSSDGDDVVYLFRANGGSFARTDLAVPGLNRRAAGRPVRLSTRFALVVTAGPDFKDSTVDDGVAVLDVIAGAPATISVPFAKNSSAGRPCVLGPDLAVVATMGADGLEGTTDDAVAVLSSIGGTNTVRVVGVGPTDDDNVSRPVRLDPTSFALATFGADRVVGTADDEITIVHGAGATPIVQHVVAGAVAGGTTSTIVPVSGNQILVAGGGDDERVGTPDDAVVVLSGIRSTLSIARVPYGGSLDSMDAFRFVPELLGGGRAAVLSSGADADLGNGGDDLVRVIDGLESPQSLDVLRLAVQFARQQPTRPSRVTVTARLNLSDLTGLTDEDLTITIGNVSQTLVAGSLQPFHGTRALRYLDVKGTRGFIRSLTYDLARRSLVIDARGADGELATTMPGYVPVSVEVGSTLVPALVSARESRNGFVFRKKHAPK